MEKQVKNTALRYCIDLILWQYDSGEFPNILTLATCLKLKLLDVSFKT